MAAAVLNCRLALATCRRAAATTNWSLLRRAAAAATTCSRPRRLHITAAAATAAHDTSEPPSGVQQIDPPPTVPFSPDAVNSVALSGTVLTDPQVHYFPANQVTAHVRLGLSPRVTRHGLQQQPQGAVSVDAWGALALQLAQHVHKGARLQVRGSLREDSWIDRATGGRRWLLKLVAEELALLAPPPEQHEAQHEQQHEQQLESAHQQQQAAQQQLQQAAAGPRVTPSAETSLRMYEQEGCSVTSIAATRNIKPSTVVDHLLAAAAAGRFASSYPRLSAELQLGPPGGQLLSPGEVAEAVADVQVANADLELHRLPLNAIRAQLSAPATASKVADLLAAGGGDPWLLYSAIKLVRHALAQGVPFSAISGQPAAGSNSGAAPF